MGKNFPATIFLRNFAHGYSRLPPTFPVEHNSKYEPPLHARAKRFLQNRVGIGSGCQKWHKEGEIEKKLSVEICRSCKSTGKIEKKIKKFQLVRELEHLK